MMILSMRGIFCNLSYHVRQHGVLNAAVQTNHGATYVTLVLLILKYSQPDLG